ncbi:hypothetical protein BU26DRAFT_550069, partial [Trematosphaeria pertusa]
MQVGGSTAAEIEADTPLAMSAPPVTPHSHAPGLEEAKAGSSSSAVKTSNQRKRAKPRTAKDAPKVSKGDKEFKPDESSESDEDAPAKKKQRKKTTAKTEADASGGGRKKRTRAQGATARSRATKSVKESPKRVGKAVAATDEESQDAETAANTRRVGNETEDFVHTTDQDTNAADDENQEQADDPAPKPTRTRNPIGPRELSQLTSTSTTPS